METMRRIPLLQAIGGLILFGAWLAQNYKLAALDDELAYLRTAQAQVMVSQINFHIWYSQLLVAQSSSTDENLLLQLEYRSALHLISYIEPSIARVSNQNTLIEYHRITSRIREKIESAHNTGNRRELRRLFNELIAFYNKVAEELLNSANSRYDAVRSFRSSLNKGFLFAYVFGSLIGGIGALRSWLAGPQSPPKPPPNQSLKPTPNESAADQEIKNGAA
jgi:hypothetical protein